MRNIYKLTQTNSLINRKLIGISESRGALPQLTNKNVLIRYFGKSEPRNFLTAITWGAERRGHLTVHLSVRCCSVGMAAFLGSVKLLNISLNYHNIIGQTRKMAK